MRYKAKQNSETPKRRNKKIDNDASQSVRSGFALNQAMFNYYFYYPKYFLNFLTLPYMNHPALQCHSP